MRHFLTRHLTGFLAALCLSVPAVLMFTTPASAADTAACDPDGTTSADGTVATQLNGQLNGGMRGAMTAYRVSCARVIAATVKSRGLPVRVAQIAITTTIVESTVRNLTYGDRDSLGLFQQRPSQGWGSAEQIMDPVYSTNKFVSKLLQFDWRNDPIGQLCQDVQVSAFPQRYFDATADGVAIANAVWAMSTAPEEIPGHSVTGDSFADVLAIDTAGALWLYSNNIRRDDGVPYNGGRRQIGNGWSNYARVIPADVTGDGFTDVLALDTAGDLWLYSNNYVRDDGMPYYGGRRQVGHGWNNFVNIVPADVTGDGFTDLLALDTAGDLWLYSNNILRDGGVPYNGGRRQVGNGWGNFSKIMPADVTGDGFTDVLALDTDGKLWLYSNNYVRDDGMPYYGGRREVGHGWNNFAKIIPADVTGDGFTDVLALDTAGDLWLYSNNYVRDGGMPYNGGRRQVGHGWNNYAQILT